MTNQPPKTVSEIFPSKYLKAEDLLGKAFNMSIVSASVRSLRGIQGEHWAIVIGLAGAKKELVLNKTQAQAIARIAGTELVDEWVGVKLQIRPGKAHNGKPTILIDQASESKMP